jgi:gamma-glutamyltranspeptidase
MKKMNRALMFLPIALFAMTLTAAQMPPNQSGENVLQAQALAAVKAIDQNEAEAEKPNKTHAQLNSEKEARSAIDKVPDDLTLCASPASPAVARANPETANEEYCSLLRSDLDQLLKLAASVSRASTLLLLDPQDPRNKDRVAKSIKEYQDHRAWLLARIQKWNVRANP